MQDVNELFLLPIRCIIGENVWSLLRGGRWASRVMAINEMVRRRLA